MDTRENRENILLGSGGTEILRSLCQADPLSQEICSSPQFWQRKFARQGLPIVTPQTTAIAWIYEYLRTLNVYGKSRRYWRYLTSGEVPSTLQMDIQNARPYEFAVLFSQIDDIRIYLYDWVDRNRVNEMYLRYKLFRESDPRGVNVFGSIQLRYLPDRQIYAFVSVYRSTIPEPDEDIYAIEVTAIQAADLLFAMLYYEHLR